MSYRNILVILDDGKRSRDRLNLALQLAEAHESLVTGLYISYVPFDMDSAPADYIPFMTKFFDEQMQHAQRVKKEFLEDIACCGVQGEWMAARSFDLKDAIAYTRSADLIIAGQRLSKGTASYVGEDFLDRLVLSAGRPVLVIPDAGPLPTSFKQISIAWNGSREAARAVADALPFLKGADTVMAFEIVPSPERNEHTSSVPKPDLKAYLQRHNVNIEMMESTGSMDTGEWILARSTSINMHADLLISGAYGHSRMTELILGGVTRSLFQNMTMPILMSH